MIKVEANVAEHEGDDGAVGLWKAHADEEDGADKVHAHDLGEQESDVRRGDGI